LCKSQIITVTTTFYGIRNTAGQWFKSYLHDRGQQAEIKLPDSNTTYSNWGIIKHGVPQGSIHDLSPTINSQSKPILFANDTNIVISYPEIDGFQICMNDVFAGLNKWIKVNKLTLNFDKTNFMKFCTTNENCVNLSIGYEAKTIEVETTKFLGLQIDNNLNWKMSIQCIIPTLSSTCFATRTVTSLIKTEILKLVYFVYYNSIMSYGIISWGNSTDSKMYFTSKRKSLE
jgi:hypothetical protein